MHLPLLRNPDKSKLSKRKNPTGILFYRAMGYLPEALINFLALLANAAREGEDELMDLAGDRAAVSRSSTCRSAARFSTSQSSTGSTRVTFANASTRRRSSSACAEWAISPERLARIAQLAAPRIERLSDLGPLLAFLFSGTHRAARPRFARARNSTTPSCGEAFALALAEFDALPAWNAFGVETVLKSHRRNAGEESPRRRAAILRRDHRQPDVDSALRFDGAARPRSRARTLPQCARSPDARKGGGVIRAIVLAAGKGTRMKSARPESAARALRPADAVVRAAKRLRGAGIDEIVVVINAELQEWIDGFGVNSVVQAEQLGTGHAVRVALESLDSGPAAGSSSPAATCRSCPRSSSAR